MVYKVLVVDDSSFFRRRVTDILNKDPQLNVIDVAVNGKEAVEKAILLKPDVITMDIEMPVLNGIDAVKQIMAKSPTAILMFSSLTHQGAKATLDALDAGALDFLPKKFSEIAKNTDEAGSLLRQRVVEIARKPGFAKTRSVNQTGITRPPLAKTRLTTNVTKATSTTKPSFSSALKDKKTLSRSSGKEYKLLAIGTSTGGPVALQKILVQLEQDFPLPIIIVQHMPAAFTAAFASRLNTLCKISIKEAEDGDILKPGCAYLAPGGRQMIISGSENSAKIKILDDDSPKITFKPSVDISFGSAAKTFAGKVLGVILTGMGSDGKEGSRMLKAKGSTIWSQDEQSCVVYGMPQAVVKAGLSQLSLPLDSMAASMVKEIGHG
ncbi:chemotaxis response regulator protein-glutamate methylesterase [Colwellia sp. MT41]|uniref:Protein-glutamate methylesterase/protein-glutamine glutaminase n=1 Tax=Colwellia marinimaniae TaxID=1513592 RepID=A0ABQ0MVC5_9GAMM|nr:MULTISPECIES: chemotaxis response regulator protein-glutamate methylesterase [Colwellia]ALO34300.1 chemotaxis response regulator protein-glutamate methylesterase [Colwellia sp. MT41]GAW96315.1 chemotaxis response regulator protein-glutamate methylesterase of group 1 operon [Colwellia marinimaniae]